MAQSGLMVAAQQWTWAMWLRLAVLVLILAAGLAAMVWVIVTA